VDEGGILPSEGKARARATPMQSRRGGIFVVVGRRSCSRSPERFAFDAGYATQREATCFHNICVQTEDAKRASMNQIDISCRVQCCMSMERVSEHSSTTLAMPKIRHSIN